ncbi:MAG: hypothetical protein PHS92_00115 [Candidatus Gracilibacteria bacterium]|nr:hypothetical protein [Candidatus Gracilibacteria bacterium]
MNLKKIYVALIFSFIIFLTSCGEKNSNIGNIKNLNNSDKLPVNENINEFNDLTLKEKEKSDCLKFENNTTKQYCNAYKNKLKTDKLIFSSDITKSIKNCDDFVKTNKDIFLSPTKCRLKIVITNYLSNLNNPLYKSDKPINCKLLESYNEKDVCEQSLNDIFKYMESKRIEKTVDEYKDIIPALIN